MEKIAWTKHGMSRTKFYTVWVNMKQRCFNKKVPIYKYYGGRGIKVCSKWMVFKNFMEDMYSSYKEGLTIGRIDNDGHYCLGNCRWEKPKEQMCNRRNKTTWLVNGKYTRTCYMCKKTKDLEEFVKSNFHYLGYKHLCSKCDNAVTRKNYKKRKLQAEVDVIKSL